MKEVRHFDLYLTKSVSTTLPKLGLLHTLETAHGYGEVHGYIIVYYFQEQELESDK